MKPENLKPGQIVEFVGDGDERPPDSWPAFKVPARESKFDDEGEVKIKVGDRFVVLECVEWDNTESYVDVTKKRLDVKILINGAVKYVDFLLAKYITYNEFRIVSE